MNIIDNFAGCLRTNAAIADAGDVIDITAQEIKSEVKPLAADEPAGAECAEKAFAPPTEYNPSGYYEKALMLIAKGKDREPLFSRPKLLRSPDSFRTNRNVRRRVLIADSCVASRRSNRFLLEHMGFEADEACDEDDALAKLRRSGNAPYSLLMVDLMNENMSGIELIRKVKGEHPDDLPAIVVCTASSDAPTVRAILMEGVDAYMLKPIHYKAYADRLCRLFPDMSLQTHRHLFLHHA